MKPAQVTECQQYFFFIHRHGPFQEGLWAKMNNWAKVTNGGQIGQLA